ncbi:MAG: TMEM14 family protein [Deltaproteobacteria bacterium]
MLHAIAIWVAAGYGVLALGGGVMGYVKAKSRASLIAGSVSGLLLLAGALLARSQPVAGLMLVSIVSAALVARFARSALGKRASAVAYVMVGGGIAVLVTAGMALA